MKALLTGILTLSFIPLTAQWSTNPALADNRVCTAPNAQNDHLVITDNAGGIISAWTDARDQATNGTDIYIERISGTGSPLWSSSPTYNGIAACNAANDQFLVALVADGTGGAFVLWKDNRNGANVDIYVQKFNGSGVAQWTVNGVLVDAGGWDYQGAKMISDGAGGVFVTFASGSPLKANVKRINSLGSVEPWLTSVAIGPSVSFPIGICTDGSGGAIVFFIDSRNDPDPLNPGFEFTNLDIFAQRIDNTGARQWGNAGVAICAHANNQDVTDATDFYKHCVSDGSGGAILVWSDFRNDPDNGQGAGGPAENVDLFAQRVDNSGTVQWTTNGVAVCTAINKQSNMNVVSDEAGGVVVVWDDFRNAAQQAIHAQRISNSGAAQWTPDGIQITTVGKLPDITPDNFGRAIITWEDNRNASTDIYGQRINLSTGAGSWTPGGVPVCTEGAGQFNPRLVFNNAGGAIIVWNDERNSATTNSDLYAALLNTSGTLPLKWGTIKAEAHNHGVLVQWQTMNESNAVSFVVERSADGVTYKDVGFVAAKGASTGANYYQLLDKNITHGGSKLYYRIREVDMNNNGSYSKIVAVIIPPLKAGLYVLDNPINDLIRVRCNALSGATLHIRVINSMGQVIMDVQKNVSTGNNIIEIPFSGKASGVYRLQVAGLGDVRYMRFIKM